MAAPTAGVGVVGIGPVGGGGGGASGPAAVARTAADAGAGMAAKRFAGVVAVWRRRAGILQVVGLLRTARGTVRCVALDLDPPLTAATIIQHAVDASEINVYCRLNRRHALPLGPTQFAAALPMPVLGRRTVRIVDGYDPASHNPLHHASAVSLPTLAAAPGIPTAVLAIAPSAAGAWARFVAEPSGRLSHLVPTFLRAMAEAADPAAVTLAEALVALEADARGGAGGAGGAGGVRGAGPTIVITDEAIEARRRVLEGQRRQEERQAAEQRNRAGPVLVSDHMARLAAEAAIRRGDTCPISLDRLGGLLHLAVPPCGHVCGAEAAVLERCPLCTAPAVWTLVDRSSLQLDDAITAPAT